MPRAAASRCSPFSMAFLVAFADCPSCFATLTVGDRGSARSAKTYTISPAGSSRGLFWPRRHHLHNRQKPEPRWLSGRNAPRKRRPELPNRVGPNLISNDSSRVRFNSTENEFLAHTTVHRTVGR